LILLLATLLGDVSWALSSTTLHVDVWTNKGGMGASTDGGSYLLGETLQYNYSVSVNVRRATLTLYMPNGTYRVLYNGSLGAGTYHQSRTAGFPEGWWWLILEAWTTDNQHVVDEVKYLVHPLRYSYTVTVLGLDTYSMGIYLNDKKIDDLMDGQTSLFYEISGTNRISVDNVIYISNDTRLYCPNQSITVMFDGNFTFKFKRQYRLQISVEPPGGGTTAPQSGWYDAGSNMTITALVNSGYSFAGWGGDYRSSIPAITVLFNRSLNITAMYGKVNNISCQISQTEARRLDAVNISGRMTPPPGHAVVLTVRLGYPNGTREVNVTTDPNGNYGLSFSPDLSGSWVISVSWNGDAIFAPATSASINLTVRPRMYDIVIGANIAASAIALRVDGAIVNASSLPRTYRWEEFSVHNITAEGFLGGGALTRYRFEGWSDGTASLAKMLTVEGDANVSATFIVQYYLSVSSEFGNSTGEGWYDQGAQAYAGIDRKEVSAGNPFQVYIFTSWGGDAAGIGLTSDPILMDGPKRAMAVWEGSFSPLLLITLGVMAMATVVIAILYLRHRAQLKQKELK
jgi:hypothetical protein